LMGGVGGLNAVMLPLCALLCKVFLHGAGESGSDPRELLSEGATGCPPVELEAGRAAAPLKDRFVVAAPQTDRGWSGGRVGAFVDALLADASLRLEPDQVRPN